MLACVRARGNSTCGRRRCGIGAGGGGRRLPPSPCPERLAGWAPRSGAPASYTPQQFWAVIALPCEKPSESERPISHWSQRVKLPMKRYDAAWFRISRSARWGVF